MRRRLVLEVRAARNLASLMAAREEYRPVLHQLKLRMDENGTLTVTEYEAIGLRELVRRAAACLPPTERKQIVRGLYGPDGGRPRGLPL